MARKAENRKTYNNVPMEYFRQKCLAIDSAGLNLSLKSENPGENGAVWFRVLHGMSMTSYGEKITITLRPMGSGTDVHILSECGLPTQIVDYGKNAKNCAAIFAYLERDIPQQGAMQPAPGIPVQQAPVRQAEQPGYPQAPAYQQAPVQPQAGYQQAPVYPQTPAQPQAPVQPQVVAAAAFAAQDFVFCPECGTKNSKSAKFCMNCGTRLIIPQ